MDNNRLNEIFKEVQYTYFPGKLRKISAEFYPYRTARHNIEWNSWTIRIKVSQIFKNAPKHILTIIGVILLSRVYRSKVDHKLRNTYNEYTRTLNQKLPPARPDYQPQGDYFDLRTIFDRLNNRHFDGSLIVKNIGWSKQNSYRRLGFYDRKRDLIVISRLFDATVVPLKVIEYLMYHEMLHVRFPEEIKNHRRRIHPPQFRAAEKEFPEYEAIQAWIHQNVPNLAQNVRRKRYGYN
jgi:predicted metal-dependent hydrolase